MANSNQFGKDGWTPAQIENTEGKTFLITGANTGAGFEATRILLSKGAKVVMLNRSPSKSHDAIATLKQEFGNDANVSYIRLDLISLNAVRQSAKEILAHKVIK